MELTILMPCLNESETISRCIRKAKSFLSENDIDGEVLISDNGSTDGSRDIALREGARVVITEEKGYGAALINGTRYAQGKYIIMGDADDSYDFTDLMPFLEKLREGFDLVMGDRFAGGIEKGAMPFSHRYIGNPVLSFLGRLFYGSDIRDFHCGLRGYDRDRFISLDLECTGMEYASEMVVMAQLNHYRIAQVPTTLSKDGRSGRPHLRSLRDGWRHLRFLLSNAPDWLYRYPSYILLALAVCFMVQSLVRSGLTVDTGMIFFAVMTCASVFLNNMYRIASAYASFHKPVILKSGKATTADDTDSLYIIGASAVFISVLMLLADSIMYHSGFLCIITSVLFFSGLQYIYTAFTITLISGRS